MNRAEVLQAMRADAIPAGSVGLWTVSKIDQHQDPNGKVTKGPYTLLNRVTTATLHHIDWDLPGGRGPGECVMLDAVCELNTHLDAVRRSRGRVLVTGLGLGCVARGILTNPRVTELVVVERSQCVLALVADHMPKDPRLTIVHADAMEWILEHADERWDCAWHDLWSDPDQNEKHLQVVHGQLILALHRRCKWQGAWAFPKRQKAAMKRFGNRNPLSVAKIREALLGGKT
jgi:hypothetical protein